MTQLTQNHSFYPAAQAPADLDALAQNIKTWGLQLGLANVGITHTHLAHYEAHHFSWIEQNFHGEMDYMARHGTKRTRPEELEPGTLSVISVRMNYLDLLAQEPTAQLHQSQQAYISRYALGKDYHKIMRKRLTQLANIIAQHVTDFKYRAFCDSAPVLEKPLATQAGLGFIGKNSLLIHPKAGSWFFLGELYTNLSLPADEPFSKQGCGPCTACIQECPTQAIVSNGVVDARRCVSYLTIEFKGSIALELRPLIGNRIYGCDDCQLVCPWNKFTSSTEEDAFKASAAQDSKQTAPNIGLDRISLLDCWQWDETTFLRRLEGSPIRRIGYTQWTRNLAVALGNVQADQATLHNIIEQLTQKHGAVSPLVDEHIEWAIQQLTARLKTLNNPATPNLEPAELSLKALEPQANLKPFFAKKYYVPTP
ncbi:tRNA epoxyqueuosine(34) reductase QueG [Thiomicrorhabdus aquaedulcis]|uniref:tRNA epoxyqueuosine(34) reductase QueG n=1 Tax=Thiomicrorhabdus aquaedulcis TaxID=2211106 RepID=UPI000FDCC521|nr:tRNA epoxyqueuosine(34) reductase QueG [Thiomicrorhabdus aquaedulcis]